MVAKLDIETAVAVDNFAELHERLGGVPLDRIGMDPPPGTATEADLLRHLDGEPKRIFELIDGTLVEKAVGAHESLLASSIIQRIRNFIEPIDLGFVTGADGPYRMLRGNVRYPDVSYVPWSAVPDGELPDEAIWSIVPALAIEVLSRSNTKREIARKIDELFQAGTQLVWVIEPETRDGVAYETDGTKTNIGPHEAFDGGTVLPGFRLHLAEVFATLKKRK